jgi:DNA (cytosine-5)-methyltransferase 1
MSELTHLSLFTGIGGIDLACEWAGFRTIAQVEKNEFCREVLEKHWPSVPRFDDVRTVTGDTLRSAGIGRPTLVSGGFPCQPFSSAGLRRGAADDRFLWPEMFRLVSELRPTWCLAENVAGFAGMGLEGCAADLESVGYEVRAFMVPACAVGAPHRRDRLFVVAHAEHGRRPHGRDVARARGEWQPAQEHGLREDVPEPGLRGVADGIPHRVDRLNALGNAVMPQQAYPFVQAIAEIETSAPATGNAGPLHV